MKIHLIADPVRYPSMTTAQIREAFLIDALYQPGVLTWHKASGSSGTTLGDYKSHSIRLSVRTASGGAEVHAHFDDILVVTGGSATLITGGTVVDGQTGADGETKGSRIQEGTSQKIAKDDIVHIPAGTPHQLTLAPGDKFSAIVVKVRE